MLSHGAAKCQGQGLGSGTLDGAIELDLRLANGSSLALQARALTATFDAAARFTEDLSC